MCAVQKMGQSTLSALLNWPIHSVLFPDVFCLQLKVINESVARAVRFPQPLVTNKHIIL